MTDGIEAKTLLRALPAALQADESLRALAESIAAQLSVLSGDTGAATLYAAIDALPEAVLDILAADFEIIWWDADASTEEKRATFKNAWYVYRHLGTKSAVERALEIYYPGATVTEWFDDGEEPFRFSISGISVNDIINEGRDYRDFLKLLSKVKRLSAHLHGAGVEMSDATLTLTSMLTMAQTRWLETWCAVPDTLDVNYLTDELGNILTDETGARFTNTE
ncbi:MAG: phage tail protein I [Oscillospiraceae bacterium]|nr:phage tail protein I [Oscillospiraceae bacterium]